MSLDVTLKIPGMVEVYTRNITHNLNVMAEAAGIYKHLWRPEEIGVARAGDLIEPLTEGLARLMADPERFKDLNPPDGWGSYEDLCDFISEYIEACKDNPEAIVEAGR